MALSFCKHSHTLARPAQRRKLVVPRTACPSLSNLGLSRGPVRVSVRPGDLIERGRKRQLTHIVNDWYQVAFDDRLPLDGLMSADCVMTDHLTRACYRGVNAIKHRVLELKNQFSGCTFCHMQADTDIEHMMVTTHWIAAMKTARKLPENCQKTVCDFKNAVFYGINVFTFDSDDKIVRIETFEVEEECPAAA